MEKAVNDERTMKDAIRYVGWPHLYKASNQHQMTVLLEQGLQPEHNLLDVGAGCLGVGRLLINYLDPGNYWALEPNTWLIKVSGVESGTFHLYTFKDWKLSRVKGKPFDFILAHSVFTHAGRDQIQTILQEAINCLSSEGKLLASFYDQGFGDSEHEGWIYPGGVTYTGEFIQRLAEKAGFIADVVKDARHPAGHTWLFGRL